MREINNLQEIYLICKALGSDIRMQILKLLHDNGAMNLNELSDILGVTNGAMTAHIKMLTEAKLIDITHSSGKRGSQKICTLTDMTFLLNPFFCKTPSNCYYAEIPIGSYCNYDVSPACGLATADSLIGEMDDPRYFCAPERGNAGIIWLATGFVEYRIPNYLKQGQRLSELKFSFEISSQIPAGCEEHPSNINFSINGVPLGFWSSCGMLDHNRGRYTPSWWAGSWIQSGSLKFLTINKEGVFVDGAKISDTTIEALNFDYKSSILLRFSVNRTRAVCCGGLTLFGKTFGNYNQDIKMEAFYQETESVF